MKIRFASFLLFTIIISSNISFAQLTAEPNSIFIEGAGNGGLYSINYDRLLTNNLSCRIGYSYLEILSAQISTYPFLVNYLYGENSSKIEIGLGIMLINISVSTELTNLPPVLSISTTLVTGAFGYRYQQKDGGIIFRADITPFYYLRSDISTKRFILSGGISLGYTF
ncbi:MAG: hypothetical protein WAV76_07350 [Bacteroidota bacterium]